MFIEDGAQLDKCKSFQYNIEDTIALFGKEHLSDTVQHSGYKQLLEFCSTALRQRRHRAVQKFKTFYTLDGT